ncbi:MAG TPA: peptide ABC transporter substrate-binding protein [Ktedonobacteraceae bacterium]
MMSFSIVALLLLILSACGGTSSTTSTTPSAGGTPVKGGTWIDDLFEEPDSLIPNASVETFAYMVDYGLYAPLVYSTPAGVMMPGIATVVPTVANGGVSADLKTVTFHLRSGLVWSDGVALDARDVDYSWKLWNNPKFPAYNTIGTAAIASADVSTDNLSITFHLKAPLVSFVSQWADASTAPMPAHHYSSMDPASITKSPDNLNPSVTSGPFMMSESKPGVDYILARNPKYYLASQGLPYLDKVVFKITPDQNTILKDLQAGSVDSSWFLNVANALAYAKLSNYTVVADPNSYSWEALWFNFHNKVLGNNPEVRKAIAMATDQQTLIDVARRGLGGKRCQDHPSVQVPGYTANLSCPQLNPDFAGANALLKQNGWVMGSDSVYSKNGQRLEFQYSTTANNLWRSDDQLINKANFAKIGIKVDIQNYPASTFFGSILITAKPGVYDIAEFASSGSIDPDNATILQTGQTGNLSYYSSAKMDALLKQEQATGDAAARQMAFDQINQLEVTDFPFVIEFSAPNVAIHIKGTNNYAPSALGIGETINIWEWWCNNGTCPA